MKLYYILLFVLPVFISACSTVGEDKEKINETANEDQVDAHSYANVHQIRTKHVHLELEVDFQNNTIYGVARHEMGGHNADTAIFDIKALEIKKVTLGKGKETPTDYVIGKHNELLGEALRVKINKDTKYINIYYQTTDKTEALDWLDPELTAGKKHPFMYTQGQAIFTRSWIPLQDTPLNRITYSADVKVPKELMAIMSASNPTERNASGKYHFEMNQKIPSYLIALAVGDLVYNSFGGKCGVYSEPEFSALCLSEFEDLPQMMSAAEKMYGPYRWDQYDIVLLPYSFPFGGMENPRLTFANPTILAGDKSLVSVIAHELAHSWSGNLVTNATWNDFWLNEGFTVYFENRIMEEIYGKEIADILANIEYQDLEVALVDIESSKHPEDAQLKLELDYRSPDEGMTDIAYVKGAFFLRTLEHLVGREKFDKFLTNYFNSHAFETITTEAFLTYLDKELLRPNKVDFNTYEWIYESGLPDNCVSIKSERLEEMKLLAEQVNEGRDIFIGTNKDLKRGDHITQEWQTFIRSINVDIAPDMMNKIDAKLKFGTDGNPALKSDWFHLAVESGNKSLRPEIDKYLNKVGRRWYIELIYQALKDSKDPSDLKFAQDVFERAKLNYHYVSKSTVEEILY